MDNRYDIQNESFCEECYNNIAAECNDCNVITFQENTVIINDGSLICDNCQENYFRCDSCGEWFDNDDNYEGDFCKQCYYEVNDEEN
jgi:hypothetical protein